MKTISDDLLNHLSLDSTTICSCWRITRTDGVVMGFTDLDVDLTIDGVDYHADSGFIRSAISASTTTASDNLQVKGYVNDETITVKDLLNGVYDYAQVEIFLVNYAALIQGELNLRYGWFGEVNRWPSGAFTVELRGLLHLFNTKIGSVFQPECRADFGDSRCQVTIVPPARANSAKYYIGDRIVVPVGVDIFGNKSYTGPIVLGNPNFDFVYCEDIPGFGNQFVAATNDTNGITPHSGSYVVVPDGGDGYLGTDVDLTAQIDTTLIDQGGTVYTFNWWQYQIGDTSVLPKMELYDGNATLINDNEQDGATTDPSAGWVQQSMNITGVGGERTLSVYNYFVNTGSPPEDSTQAPVYVDDWSVDWTAPDGSTGTFASGESDFPYTDFELTHPHYTQLPGWTTSDYVAAVPTTWGAAPALPFFRRTFNPQMAPPKGYSSYIQATHASATGGSISQTGAFNDDPSVTGAIIDTGTFYMEATVFVSALTFGMGAEMSISFLDQYGRPIGTALDTGMQRVQSVRTWTSLSAKGFVPVGARAWTVTLRDVVLGPNLQTPRSTCFAGVNVRILTSDLIDLDYRQYGNVEFVAGDGSKVNIDNVQPIDIYEYGYNTSQGIGDGLVLGSTSTATDTAAELIEGSTTGLLGTSTGAIATTTSASSSSFASIAGPTIASTNITTSVAAGDYGGAPVYSVGSTTQVWTPIVNSDGSTGYQMTDDKGDVYTFTPDPSGDGSSSTYIYYYNTASQTVLRDTSGNIIQVSTDGQKPSDVDNTIEPDLSQLTANGMTTTQTTLSALPVVSTTAGNGLVPTIVQQQPGTLAGTTASTQPTFNTTIGSKTVDGSITWTCIQPKFAMCAKITGTPGYFSIETDVATRSGVADGLFNWGICKFLTGQNEGKSVDVKASNAQGDVQFMLPVVFPPAKGDVVLLIAGCDKTRDTCNGTFSNIVNFRGEPDLPGTDQYFKIGVPG